MDSNTLLVEELYLSKVNQYDIAISATKALKNDLIDYCSNNRFSVDYDNSKFRILRSLDEIGVLIKRVENNHSRNILKNLMRDLHADLKNNKSERKLLLCDQLMNIFHSIPIREALHPNK